MKKIPILFFLLTVAFICGIETFFLSGLYSTPEEVDVLFWLVVILLFTYFPVLIYIMLFLFLFRKQKIELLSKYLIILIILSSGIQLINMLRVHEPDFYLLSLGNIYFTIFVLLFIHLKFYVDETTFDMRVSIFQQMKLKDILFDYGYLILLGLPLKYPNVYSILGTALVLALLLAIDFKYTKHKNEKRKLEMNEEIS